MLFGLKDKLYHRGLAGLYGDILFLLAVSFLPGFDLVLTGRKAGNGETAGVAGDGEEGVVEDGDVATHPAVDVAFDVENLGSDEIVDCYYTLVGLGEIEARIDFSKRVDIVKEGIGVSDVQRLAGHQAQDMRGVHATL